MVVRGRQLVDQASKRLKREQVEHGVRMGNDWRKNHRALVQACSIDTLLRRNDFPSADLLVIDEAHLFVSEPCKRFMAQYPNSYVLAVTATPWVKESLEHIADTYVRPITFQELVDLGFLMRPRYFAPSEPDMKGVRIDNGDYNAGQAAESMRVITGDIVQHWMRIAEGRPTVAFAATIQHSQNIVAAFNEAGIPAEHIEGNHSFEERQAAISRLENGVTKILSNVGVLCTGVDIPSLSCLIMARPTKSRNLYVQQGGRGTRPLIDSANEPIPDYRGRMKEDFMILDHAGNVMRHGRLNSEPEINIEGDKPKENEVKIKKCPKCFLVTDHFAPSCPECGYSFAPIPSDDAARDMSIQVQDGHLRELGESPDEQEIMGFVARLKVTQKLKGYKYGWIFHKVKERYGEENANKYCTRQHRGPHSPSTYDAFTLK